MISLDLDAFGAFAASLQIPSRDAGIVPLSPLFGTQRYMLQEIAAGLERGIHEHIVLKGGRQIGGTTIDDALSLWWAQANAGTQGMVVSDDDPNRDWRRDVLTGMLDSLPIEYKMPVRLNNRGMLAWKNGSRLAFEAAGLRSGSNLGRSRGLNLLHADEVGSWQDQKAVSALRAALSQTHPLRLYLWNSTARGIKTVFHDMWKTASVAVTQKAIFTAWWRREDFKSARGTDVWKAYGRGERTEDERRWISAVKKRYRVTITDEQLAWYRYTLAETMLGDETMMAQEYGCLAGSTRISTESGIIPISEAEPDELYSYRTTESGKVTGFYPRGARAVVRAITRDGRHIVGTSDHPVELEDGSFCDLGSSQGKRITLRPPRFSECGHEVTWMTLGGVVTSILITPLWARFLGYFMGDGCYSRKRVSIACNATDTDVIHDVASLVQHIFGRHHYEHRKGCVTVIAGSAVFEDVMKRLGIWNPGTHSKTLSAHRRVCVPEAIFRSSEPSVKEFLRGLFESDGFISDDATRIILFSKHNQFLRDVQLLLLGFGITSRIKKERKSLRGRTFYGYALQLRALEARRFTDEVGFVGKRKSGRVRPINKYGSSALPIVMRDEVVKVEDAGTDVVFDISIDSAEHTFSANGIVVHNCIPEDCFQAWGDKFIAPMTIQKMRLALDTAPHPEGWRYEWGATLDETTLSLMGIDLAPLLIWEQPHQDGVYLISAHPAWSSSPNANLCCIQVWRVWPDKMTLVAEYTTESGSTYQCAWAAMHLAGAYRTFIPAYFICEVGGTGYRVLEEIQLIQNVGHGLSGRAKKLQLADFLGSVNHYFFWKPDMFSSRVSTISWRTQPNTRPWLLNGLSDTIERGYMDVRSESLIDELAMLRRGEAGDNDQIEGASATSDARAICAAMAVECWLKTALPDLDRLIAKKEPGPKDAKSVEQRLVQDYLFRKLVSR